jgi:hypothetical protein
MNFASEQFFAGSRFSNQQHVGICGGNFTNGLQQILQSRAGTNDLIKPCAASEVFSQSLIFAIQVLKFEQSLQAFYQFLKANWLHKIIKGSGRKRFHCIFDSGVCRDDQHKDCGIDAVQLSQDFDTIAVGKLNVANSDIVVTLLSDANRFSCGGRSANFKTFPHQRIPRVSRE